MSALKNYSDDITNANVDTLVLGWQNSALTPATGLGAEVTEKISAAATALEVTDDLGSVTVLPGAGLVSAARIVVVGIGAGTDNDLRFAAGAAARHLGKKVGQVLYALPSASASATQAVAEGALLGTYRFDKYKTDAEVTDTEFLFANADAAGLSAAEITGSAVNFVRDLVNTPALGLFPDALAQIATERATAVGCDVEVWDESRLRADGFGGILAVGQGSTRAPRLVKLSYRGPGATQQVALVGKGITFDTGGISLKPAKSMETMKSDMSGAAAVAAVIIAAAQMELPVAVEAWLCIAENMPGGAAQRPSDVIKVYGGKTVEVLNTDAEGRLVLADGLVKAQESNPDYLIDVATLTGAQGVALGVRTSGVMGSSELRAAVVAAADAVGEDMWEMPLPAYLADGLKSKVADIQNIGDASGGGMLSGGLFLKEFVGDSNWAHLDIARPAFNEASPYGYTVAGATGVAVRTLLEFLRGIK